MERILLVKKIFRCCQIGVLAAFSLGSFAQDLGHSIAEDLHSGNLGEAQKLLTQALQASPNDARLWTLNGIARAKIGDAKTALDSFRRALRLAPDYLPALESTARIEFEDRDSQAVIHLKKLSKLRPDDQDVHSMLATLYFEQGDCAAARDQIQRDEIGAAREYGACLVRKKQIGDAIPVFDQLHREEPDDPATLYDLALVHFLAHQFTWVIDELGPQGEKLNADALDILGESYAATGRPDVAVKVFARAIVFDSSDPNRYVRFAHACLPVKQFNAALETLNAGIQAHPDSAALYVSRGIVQAELGRYDLADADLQRGEVLDPNEISLSGAIGLTELQRNDLTQAEIDVRARLRQHPHNAMLHYVLAETLLKQGATPGTTAFAEAMHSAELAVAENPNLPAPHDVLGRLYLQSGNTAAAVRESRISMKLNPSDPTAIYHLILALRRNGDTGEVKQLINKLASLRLPSAGQRMLEENLVERAPAIRHGDFARDKAGSNDPQPAPSGSRER